MDDSKIKPTSKHLKDLLGNFEKKMKSLERVPVEDILNSWPTLVGNNIAEMTKAVEFKDATLFIKVSNAALYSLLTLHEKDRLIDLLKIKYPSVKIKTIQFRLG